MASKKAKKKASKKKTSKKAAQALTHDTLQNAVRDHLLPEAGGLMPKRPLNAPHDSATGGPPTNLDFEKSMMFFHAYMYGPLQGKLRLYGARAIPTGSVAMSSDWEVFASMLVNDMGRKFGPGIDLTNHEVKSAKRGGSYEYQYHKKAGREKLAKDMEVGHLFFDYFGNLREVDLRYAHGSAMKHFFEKWLREYPEPYPQRYRNNIPYGWVKENGILLMTIKDGEVIYPQLVFEAPPDG